MIAFKPLAPGIALMRRMRLPTKLGVLAFVLLVPLVVITVFWAMRLSDDIRIAQEEVRGVDIARRLSEVVNQVQMHRDQVHLTQAGVGSWGGALDKTQADLDRALKAMDLGVVEHASFELQDEWRTLRARIERLASPEEERSGTAFAEHSAVVQALMQFLYTAAERSSLLFDPVPATYFLMDQGVSRIVSWVELLDQIRGLGAGSLANSAGDAVVVARIESLIGNARAAGADMAYLQRLLAQYGQSDLDGKVALDQASAYLDQTEKALKEPGLMDASGLFERGTAAIDAVKRYEAAVGTRLTKLLEQRILEAQRLRTLTLVATSAGLFLLFYLMLSFFMSFVRDFRQLVIGMRETASGNLRSRVKIRGNDELAELANMLATMNVNLSGMVAEVRSNSALVAWSGQNLAAGNQALADRTEQQAASLEQTVASVQELSSTVRQNAVAAGDSDVQATKVREVADTGVRAMSEAIESVEVIQNGAQRMNEIIGVIDSIAFQTNILALNAAVEAARAGEQGRGFAVVANEVRTLAQRSAASSREIRALIEASSNQVASSVQRIRLAGDNMSKIVDGVRDVAANMSLISGASADQSAGLTQISAVVSQLDEITQRNAHMVDKAVLQAHQLASRAGELSHAVASFNLQQGTADEAVALVQRALALREAGNGDSFVRDLTDPSMGFFDRDMYVFALDHSGAYRSFGGKPEKVGSRVQDIPGVDGQTLLDAIVAQAETGPGWVEYDIMNPTSGRVQTKMSYVQKVDGLYVGCGIYKSVVAQSA